MTGCENEWASAVLGSVVYICITVVVVVAIKSIK